MIHTFAADSTDHCDCREDSGTLSLAYRAQLGYFTGDLILELALQLLISPFTTPRIALKVAVQEEMQMRHLWVRHVLGMSWTLWLLFWDPKTGVGLIHFVLTYWLQMRFPPGNVFRGHRILLAIIQAQWKDGISATGSGLRKAAVVDCVRIWLIKSSSSKSVENPWKPTPHLVLNRVHQGHKQWLIGRRIQCTC